MKRSLWVILLLAACGEGPAPAPALFRVEVSGSGSGTVSSSPSGISCTLTQGSASGTCAASFPAGQALVLTQAPASDWEFQTWSGVACASGQTCQFMVGQATAVSVVFEPAGGPGPMRLDLGSAAAGGGGIVLAISGGVVTGLTATAGYQIRSGPLGAAPLLILVRGNLAAGKLADLQVTDRKAPFSVSVQGVSAGVAGSYLPLAAGTFQAAVTRP